MSWHIRRTPAWCGHFGFSRHRDIRPSWSFAARMGAASGAMHLQTPGHLKTMKCASTLSALTMASRLRAHCARSARSRGHAADEEGDDDQEAVLPADMDARVKELCAALAEAERGGHAFIALKWFRDSFLPRKAFRWNQHPETRQMVSGRGHPARRGDDQQNRESEDAGISRRRPSA